MGRKCGSKTKASWDKEALHTFCDLCVREVEIGNRPGMCLTKKGWRNVISTFAKETGREYEYLQLRSKWDMLKKDWKLWKLLIGNETGIKWNSLRGTIHGSDGWWEEKIKDIPEAKRFRSHGIEPELEQKLDKMFTFVCNLDEYAPVPSDSDELEYLDEPERPRKRKLRKKSFGDDKSERIEFVDDPIPSKLILGTNSAEENISPNNSSKMEAVVDSDPSPMNQFVMDPVPSEPIKGTNPIEITFSPKNSPKVDIVVDPAPKPMNQADQLPDGSESRSRAASIKCDHMCSITDAIRLLDSINEVPKASPLYYFAIKLILDKDKREVFMALTPETKVWWLKMEEQESRK